MIFKKSIPLVAAAALLAGSIAAQAQSQSNAGTQNVNPLETEQGSTTTEKLARLHGLTVGSGHGVMLDMDTTGSIAPAPAYDGMSYPDRAVISPLESGGDVTATQDMR